MAVSRTTQSPSTPDLLNYNIYIMYSVLVKMMSLVSGGVGEGEVREKLPGQMKNKCGFEP